MVLVHQRLETASVNSEANDIHWNAGIRLRSSHIPFHQSTQWNIVIRSKACETITMGGSGLELQHWTSLHTHLSLI